MTEMRYIYVANEYCKQFPSQYIIEKETDDCYYTQRSKPDFRCKWRKKDITVYLTRLDALKHLLVMNNESLDNARRKIESLYSINAQLKDELEKEAECNE